MGKKANPALIGAFVVGALVLALGGLLLFGSGRLFKHTVSFVMFFPGDVNGLSIGAPVKFKGVEIGSVSNVQLRFGDMKQMSADEVGKGIRIPVFVEIDPDKVRAEGAGTAAEPAQIKLLIDLGLRAQLNSQSLVTGLLFVQLDFFPDIPAVLVLPPDARPPEIPTVPTALAQVQSVAQDLVRRLEKIPLERLVVSAADALDAVKVLAQSPGLQASLQALPDAVANFNLAIADIRKLTGRFDHGQEALLASLKGTSDQAGATLERARGTLDNLHVMLGPNAALAVQLSASTVPPR